MPISRRVEHEHEQGAKSKEKTMPLAATPRGAPGGYNSAAGTGGMLGLGEESVGDEEESNKDSNK